MAKSGIVVGAQALCFVNGKLMGEISSVDWESSTERIQRKGIDSITAYEISPIGAQIQGNISLWRIHSAGGLEGRGVVAPFSHIPYEKYFSILIVDRSDGSTLYQADHCMVTRQSWSVKAKSQIIGSFSFVGIEGSQGALGYP